MTDSKPGGDRGYRRSWKNLLINKSYQLPFTLFMAGLAAILMAGLGVWVMRVANETTTISMTSARGVACPEALPGDDDADEAPAAAPVDPARPADPAAPAPAPAGDVKPASETPKPIRRPGRVHGKGRHKPAVPATAPAVGSAGSAGDEPRRASVQIDESSMTLTPPPPEPPPPPRLTKPNELADQISAHWQCEIEQVAELDRLARGRLQILWTMIVTGLMLVVGLAAYGLKMTHRVAGPLFKVRLYLTKMRQGRFDTVYNLRKGDQLVEFYDHFKRAHGGVVAMQRADIDQLGRLIAAAEAAGQSQHPAVAELRELMARKEKSIE